MANRANLTEGNSMATAIKDVDLSGRTIRYGNIQFGGAGGPLFDDEPGTAVKATPPQFRLELEAEYDSAGRDLAGHVGTLELTCWIYSEGPTLQETQLDRVRQTLLSPRQSLSLTGTGLGFPAVAEDIQQGPRPLACTLRPIGRQSAELTWSVEFHLPACELSGGASATSFKSFHVRQSFDIDDHGLLSRTTHGGYEVVPETTGGVNLADAFREDFSVDVPTGFRRESQRFEETADRAGLAFRIVDSQLRGEVLPTSIVTGDGSWSIESAGGGFSQATLRLQATLTVAPGVAPSVAASQFFTMAQQKQADYLAGAGNQATIAATSLTIRRGLWEHARTTRFEITWTVATCIGNFLNSGFWQPLPSSNYATWSQSIATCWHPRGVADLGASSQSPTDVNLCEEVSQVTISTPSGSNQAAAGSHVFDVSCGTVDPAFSWLDYDVELKLVKREHKTFHRRAASPNRSSQTITDGLYGTGGMQPAETFSPGANSDIVEENGMPEQLLMLKAKGLRLSHFPVFPQVISIAGQAVELVSEQLEVGPALHLGCPAFKMRGYRLYRVLGPIGTINVAPASPLVCSS